MKDRKRKEKRRKKIERRREELRKHRRRQYEEKKKELAEIKEEALIQNKKKELSSPNMVLPGVNEPCICGSEKKFKKCCYRKIKKGDIKIVTEHDPNLGQG